MNQEVIKDSPRQLLHSIRDFFSGTMLSRCTGMIRDVTMAFCFGTAPAIAAFMMAFRFANLLRRLLAESPMSSSFIPHFTTFQAEDTKKGAHFFCATFVFFVCLLLALIGVIEGSLFGLLKFGGLSDSSVLIIKLTMIMVPGLMFITLYGLNSAFLHAERHFFVTSVAPVFFNCVWIIGALSLNSYVPMQAVYPLAFVIVLALAAQWLITLPPSLKIITSSLSVKEAFQIKPYLPLVRRLMVPFALGLFGIGVSQINSALDVWFAWKHSPEGPAYLWYAFRLQQLPLALFGIALTQVALPSLARAEEANDPAQFKNVIDFGVGRAITYLVPATAMTFCLGIFAVNLLYGRGAFSTASVIATSKVLWAYGLGLLPIALIMLFSAVFFAKKDFKTPAYASFFGVLTNILLNTLFVFVFKLGVWSVALATSLSAIGQVLYLYYHFPLPMRIRKHLFRCVQLVFISLMAGCINVMVSGLLLDHPSFYLADVALMLPRFLQPQLVEWAIASLSFFAPLYFGLRYFKVKWHLS